MTSTLLVPLQIVGIIYNIINFCQTKIGGEPVYDFLSWDPVQDTVIFVVILIGGFSVFYMLLCQIDKSVKIPFESSNMKTTKVRWIRSVYYHILIEN